MASYAFACVNCGHHDLHNGPSELLDIHDACRHPSCTCAYYRPCPDYKDVNRLGRDKSGLALCGKMLNTGTGSTTCQRQAHHHGPCSETDADAAPAPFEALRRYAAEAVDQLVKELVAQQASYCVPADDALSLIKAIAAIRHESPWDVWESWALRHAVPVHRLVAQQRMRVAAPTEEQRRILHARLLDLLGYAVLALVMCEEENDKT